MTKEQLYEAIPLPEKRKNQVKPLLALLEKEGFTFNPVEKWDVSYQVDNMKRRIPDGVTLVCYAGGEDIRLECKNKIVRMGYLWTFHRSYDNPKKTWHQQSIFEPKVYNGYFCDINIPNLHAANLIEKHVNIPLTKAYMVLKLQKRMQVEKERVLEGVCLTEWVPLADKVMEKREVVENGSRYSHYRQIQNPDSYLLQTVNSNYATFKMTEDKSGTQAQFLPIGGGPSQSIAFYPNGGLRDYSFNTLDGSLQIHCRFFEDGSPEREVVHTKDHRLLYRSEWDSPAAEPRVTDLTGRKLKKPQPKQTKGPKPKLG